MEERERSIPSGILSEEENNENDRRRPSSRKLRVTFLASEWRSSKGSLSTIYRELAINIAKDPEVEVTFFVPRCNVGDREAAKGQRVHLLEAERSIGSDELFLPKDLLIDVVVGYGIELGRRAPSISKSHQCKWVQVVHTAHEEMGLYKEDPNPISNAQKRHELEVELCKLSDFVVTIGPKLSEAFRRSCGKDECFLEITPGILTEFSGVTQVCEEMKTLRVLCFGCGDPEDYTLRGVDIAASAVAKLSHCHLVFVSAADVKLEDTKHRLLEYGIAPFQLTLRSLLDYQESLEKELLEVDLVVMPSRTEGFGVIGLQALSAGLPVLVGRNSGLGEALMNVSFGSYFVIDSDDPEVWAKAIENVHNKERTMRLQECEMLRGLYQEKYSWEKQSKSLIEKVINMIDDPPRDCQGFDGRGIFPDQQTKVTIGPHTEVSVRPPSEQRTVPIVMSLKGVKRKRKDEVQKENLKQQLMAEMTKCFVEKHAAQMSSDNFPLHLYYYLQGVLDLTIKQAGEGSLRIIVECRTLEILERLWEDYSSGHLNAVAEERLSTDEIKRKYDVESIELETTILKEDYLACKLSFAEFLGEDQTVNANIQADNERETTTDTQKCPMKSDTIIEIGEQHPVSFSYTLSREANKGQQLLYRGTTSTERNEEGFPSFAENDTLLSQDDYLSKQDNNGFGPIFKRRGKTTTFSSIIVMIISGAILMFAVKEKDGREGIAFVVFSTALLTLSFVLGELVRRFCLISEEVKHEHTRYQGNWRAVFTSTFTFSHGTVVLFVSITCTLALHHGLNENYNVLSSPEFYILFFLNWFVVPQLLFLVGLRDLSPVEESDLNERKNKNLADGMAWSYYFGYLRLVLPKLRDCIARSDLFRHRITDTKLFILLPKTCHIFHEIPDPRIKLAGTLPSSKINRAGSLERTYKHAVHLIEMPQPDGTVDEYYFVLEYATPLISIYEMTFHPNVHLSRLERDHQVVLFFRKLREILDDCNECRGKYELVPIPGDSTDRIAEIVVGVYNASLLDKEAGEETR